MPSLEIKSNQKHALSSFPKYDAHVHEIDLLNLINTLWSAKKRILASVLVFSLVGLLIPYLLPPKWTSNAIVTAPEATQWSQLYQRMATLQVLGVNVDISRDDVFNLFLKKFNSQQEIKEFIISTPTLMANLKNANANTMELHGAIGALSAKMKAVSDNVIKKNDSQPYSSWTFSFTGPTPLEAQSVLDGYIKFVAAKVVSQSLENLRNTVALKVQTDKDALELERAKLANIQDTKIKRLNYSLEVAKAAGITRPVYSNGQAVKDDPDFSIALGTDGIERKLAIEKSITDVAELNAELRNSEYQLKLLKKVSVTDMTFPVFKFQLSPSLPVKDDGPRKGVIVTLAALLGGLFACGSVLLGHAIATRRMILEK